MATRQRPSPLRIPTNADDMEALHEPSSPSDRTRDFHVMSKMSHHISKLTCSPSISSPLVLSMTPPSTPPTKSSSEAFSQTQPAMNGNLTLDLDESQLIGEGLWSKVYKVELDLAVSSRLQSSPLSLAHDLPSPPTTPQKTTGPASQLYAVKSAARSDAKEVFEAESRILTLLSIYSRSSDYVVPFFGIYNDSTALVLHCASTDLATFATTFSSPASISPCLDFYASVSKQLISGLTFLHSHHVIHTDIKPANVLLDFPASGPVARYCDFSAASITHLSPSESADPLLLTPGGRGPSTGSFSSSMAGAGTWTFMAPELLSSNTATNQPTYASDVYALGITLLTVLLGGASPYRDLEGANMFLLREAIKTGAPVGFARSDAGLGKRLRTLEGEDAGRRALAGVAMAVKKKNADRASAADWRTWAMQ